MLNQRIFCLLVFLCFEIYLQVVLEAENFDYNVSFKFTKGLLK